MNGMGDDDDYIMFYETIIGDVCILGECVTSFNAYVAYAGGVFS